MGIREVVSGVLRRISIKPEASTVFLAIRVTENTTSLKGTPFGRLYGTTSITPCILAKDAIIEVRIRERQDTAIPSPLVT
jgi:hypothetical protein